ncbi:hypothetical protein OFY73_004612 [Salmonella enterica]|nr:hypothetical protein [Salmonella enterica subsp. enterica serovar Edinburgh]EBH8903892.1 ABC transporter ATP-binding protein [Salmonella enterica subsp. enterica serovar 6,7:b:-]EBH8908200.1 ABC transporter ATP-binding protein [Salmonella enterica subsp. enterica serovar Santiago]EHG2695483.1 hypothetical protein [Salmonella enterica]EBH8944616.1 ABC transporter ATP-binding protein [Salmonella enterica subsp. enterica serovar 6,7:b:-]
MLIVPFVLSESVTVPPPFTSVRTSMYQVYLDTGCSYREYDGKLYIFSGWTLAGDGEVISFPDTPPEVLEQELKSADGYYCFITVENSSVLIIISPVLISRTTGYLMSDATEGLRIIFTLGAVYVFAISAQKIITFWATYLQLELRVECIASISEFFLRKLYNSGSQKDNAGGISQQLSQATNDIYIIIRELTFGLLPPPDPVTYCTLDNIIIR